MRFAAALKILGLMLIVFSLSMLPPCVVAIIYHDHDFSAFITSFLITLGTGVILWAPLNGQAHELKSRDGFLVVVLFWFVLSMYGSIPFYFYFYPHLAFVDALFESVSGITTTGGSVLTHLDAMPHSILYYRQQLHLLGGLGIILLAVAILPILGIGGMQLYRAETSGPIKTEKLRPRIRHTAKALWYIYMGLVVLCAISFWCAGMNPFDAIGESFSTVSTGGFSLHDSNFAYYNSHLIQLIAVIFMFFGSTNFGLHYQFIHHRNLKVYLHDPEFRTYVKILVSSTLICTIVLLIHHAYHPNEAFLNSLFAVISMESTTGYISKDFSQWPSFLPLLIMFITLIGGCGASAAGGLKVIRCLLLKKQVSRELSLLIHPQGVFVIKLGERIITESVMQAVGGFIAVFFALFVVLFLLLYATGLDILTSFSALIGCISNTGAGLGAVAGGFGNINSSSKWILILAMLMGRLEIFTVLVLFTPSYWRK